MSPCFLELYYGNEEPEVGHPVRWGEKQAGRTEGCWVLTSGQRSLLSRDALMGG